VRAEIEIVLEGRRHTGLDESSLFKQRIYVSEFPTIKQYGYLFRGSSCIRDCSPEVRFRSGRLSRGRSGHDGLEIINQCLT
jgi:hypothetical protein